MSSPVEVLLAQQNDRLKFYNDDFWEVAKFFSAVTIALLSAPFAVWAQDARPRNWAVIVAAAPALAGVIALVAYSVLKRTSASYYEAGASVVVLERVLGMHHCDDGKGEKLRLVAARRAKAGMKSVDDLTAEYNRRLRGIFGTSRMSVVLRLFGLCAIVGGVETAVLLLRGIWGVNLVRLFVAGARWI